jgi:hypothetical protein
VVSTRVKCLKNGACIAAPQPGDGAELYVCFFKGTSSPNSLAPLKKKALATPSPAYSDRFIST